MENRRHNIIHKPQLEINNTKMVNQPTIKIFKWKIVALVGIITEANLLCVDTGADVFAE